MKPSKGQSQLRVGRTSLPGQCYFVTTVAKDGQRIFISPFAAQIVLNSLKWLDEQGMIKLIAAVVMPDHLHFVAELRRADLSRTVKSLKGYTSREINRLLGRQGSLWQSGYHDHGVRREEDLMKLVRYCLENPVRKGLVTEFRLYHHWFCVYSL